MSFTRITTPSLHIFAILSIFTMFFVGHSAFASITVCDSGNNLSYDQTKDAHASGELLIENQVDLGTNHVTIIVTNKTPCSIPLSTASYKMYGPYSLATQSQQEFFDGTGVVNVAPNSTVTLGVDIPECAVQYDIWYGEAPRVIADNQPYGNMIFGDQVRQDLFCTIPIIPPVIVQPIVATLSVDSICVVPGTPITFIAEVSGDNINSTTLEKDTNSDGSYGEVISWGSGPRTSAFTSSEPSSYSGVYSIKLMVNGIEMGEKDVIVNTSCSSIVIPPPALPPPVIPLVVVPPPVVPVVVVVPPVIEPVIVPVVLVEPVVVVVPPVVEPIVPVVLVEPVVVVSPVVIPAVIVTVTPTSGGSSSGSRRHEQILAVADVVYKDIIITFPDTGFAPREKEILLNISMIASFLLLIFGVIGLTKKNKKVISFARQD
jgi:hypothetical protein